MAKTLTGIVANMIQSTRPDSRFSPVFNDRLKDGRRSLKVKQWSDEQNGYAQALLVAMGCTVEVTATPVHKTPWAGCYGGITRLHVTEPAQ